MPLKTPNWRKPANQAFDGGSVGEENPLEEGAPPAGVAARVRERFASESMTDDGATG